MRASSHPYRLRSIELHNFKSVARSALDLRPLSVVVGANSSGKSTLLQAILAVAQAVRAETGAAEFPLNGEFVRLGTLDETRNFLAEDQDSPMLIKVGLADRLRRQPRRLTQIGRVADEGWMGVDWALYLSSDVSPESGFARVGSLELEVSKLDLSAAGERERLLTLDLTDIAWSNAGVDLQRASRRAGHLGVRPIGAELAPVSASGRLMDWQTGSPARVDAVSLVGGIPVDVMSQSEWLEALSRFWWDAASELLEEMLAEAKLDYAEQQQTDGAKVRKGSRSAINQAYSDILQMQPEALGTEEDVLGVRRGYPRDPQFFFYQQLAQLPDAKKRSIARCMVQIGEANFRDRLRRKLKGNDWLDEQVLVDPSRSSSDLLYQAGLIARRFFGSAIYYLGPLREAPHVLYDPGPTRIDLGVNGEYSAAILHAQAGSRVRMPTLQGDGEWSELSRALDFWLEQFGMARSAQAEDRGRIGIGLRVRPLHADRSVDLTSVGVGVSQLLPVILLCLLAPPGTLVILEQPELHLHPALQQKLADFLLACVRSGRQLLVETHSEHLVNRLRRRVVEDETDETQQLVGLLFAEQQKGLTQYRPSEVNVLGGLDQDWPDGFLDLGANEAQSLLQSSLQKRRLQTRDAGQN